MDAVKLLIWKNSRMNLFYERKNYGFKNDLYIIIVIIDIIIIIVIIYMLFKSYYYYCRYIISE